jgi:AcrR family transcriptional regulator
MSTDPIDAIIRAAQDELLSRGTDKFTYSAVGERVGMTANGVKWWAPSLPWLHGQCADRADQHYVRAFSATSGTPQERLETAVSKFRRALGEDEISGRSGVLSLDLYRQPRRISPEHEQLFRVVEEVRGRAPSDWRGPSTLMVVALLDSIVGLEPTLLGAELNQFSHALTTVLRIGLARCPNHFPEQCFLPAASDAPTPNERAQILEVATRHAIDRDPKGLRIEAIAKGMGVSKTIVYKHFEDRPALVSAVVEESLADALRVVERPRGPEVQRWHHFAATIRILAQQRQKGRLILDERLFVELPADAQDRARQASRKLKAALAAAARELGAIGVIQGLRSEWMVAILLAAINGAYEVERGEIPAYVRSLFVGVLRT